MLIVIFHGDLSDICNYFNEKFYGFVIYCTGIILPNLPHSSYYKGKTLQTIQN